MSDWSYEQIRAAADGSWVVEPGDDRFVFTGASIDTRELEAGQIFFAFVGEHADGHRFLHQAADRRAALCVVTRRSGVPDGFDVPTLFVADALSALTSVADRWRESLKCTVVGITGSNGKTTTCRMLHGVCARAGGAFVSRRSYNNALGVPLTILNTPSDADYLIAEVGMSTPGEIAARCALLRPDIAIITSIGRAHLRALGSVAGVAREKAAIVRALPEGGCAFVPSGSPDLNDALAGIGHADITRLGVDHEFVIHAELPTGVRFSVDAGEFALPLPGAHNASNAALCVLASRAMGIDDETIRTGLAQAKGPEMRFDRTEIPTHTDPIVVYNDAYNANPDSMRAALSTFAALDLAMPRVAVLGEMLELGEHARREHEALADELGEHNAIDHFVLVGESFQTVPMSHLVQIHRDTTRLSIERIAAAIDPGTCVLLKGSRGVRLERILDELRRLHADAEPAPRAARTPA